MCVWDQTNTVLVDDSLETPDSQPYNFLHVEEFTHGGGNTQDDILGAVLAYMKNLV